MSDLTTIIPEQTVPDPAGDYARAQAWAMLIAKYKDSGNWAVWSANMLNANIADLHNKLGEDAITPALADLLALIDSIPEFTAGTATYADPGFTDSTLTALRSRIEADIANIDGAEAAVYARHRGRVDAERAAAYTEMTTRYSAGGWDLPPGALLAKQTEMNNEAGKRATDASADIMMTSAREAMQGGLQLVDMLGRLYDSKVVREFEAAKLTVITNLDGYKSTLGLIQTKAEIMSKAATLQVEAALRQMGVEIETLRGLAQSSAQMVASALNSVSSSTSFGFSGSASTGYDGDIDKKMATNVQIATLNQSPGGY